MKIASYRSIVDVTRTLSVVTLPNASVEMYANVFIQRFCYYYQKSTTHILML